MPVRSTFAGSMRVNAQPVAGKGTQCARLVASVLSLESEVSRPFTYTSVIRLLTSYLSLRAYLRYTHLISVLSLESELTRLS